MLHSVEGWRQKSRECPREDVNSSNGKQRGEQRGQEGGSCWSGEQERGKGKQVGSLVESCDVTLRGVPNNKNNEISPKSVYPPSPGFL